MAAQAARERYALSGASLREGACYTTENLSRKQIVPLITKVL